MAHSTGRKSLQCLPFHHVCITDLLSSINSKVDLCAVNLASTKYSFSRSRHFYTTTYGMCVCERNAKNLPFNRLATAYRPFSSMVLAFKFSFPFNFIPHKILHNSGDVMPFYEWAENVNSSNNNDNDNDNKVINKSQFNYHSNTRFLSSVVFNANAHRENRERIICISFSVHFHEMETPTNLQI